VAPELSQDAGGSQFFVESSARCLQMLKLNGRAR